MINIFKNLFINEIGIDLGTKNTVVYNSGKGIILREPSVVAIDQRTNDVISIGQEAYNMVGKTPSNIIAIRPLREGVISDFDITGKMVSNFVMKASPKKLIRKQILIGIPWGITNVEQRAVLDASNLSGASETLLVPEPMAAAIGADIDVTTPNGNLIIDIGGGTTEVAVISLGGIVVCHSERIAGDAFDEQIIQYCRQNFNILIGDQMAEKIKMTIGSAYPLREEKTLTVKGRDLITGLPKPFTITSYDVREAITDPLNTIINLIRVTFEKTPPELSSDILKNGIIMTGGGSLLKGLDERIQVETQLSVKHAKNPLTCVAVGTGKILEDSQLREKVRSSLIS
ncbi:rod shape-determining protein [Candidatus Marinamargulisbacteria bacterium SCGC AG-410-N11]|nr:rod shape-determining protein [Candidatus Marinamargulisbacteria bacterium SCGC AG-410-N11]